MVCEKSLPFGGSGYFVRCTSIRHRSRFGAPNGRYFHDFCDVQKPIRRGHFEFQIGGPRRLPMRLTENPDSSRSIIWCPKYKKKYFLFLKIKNPIIYKKSFCFWGSGDLSGALVSVKDHDLELQTTDIFTSFVTPKKRFEVAIFSSRLRVHLDYQCVWRKILIHQNGYFRIQKSENTSFCKLRSV